jgi:hypothetical protein
MHNAVVKYLMISLLLLVYINRGFFIANYEVENRGNKEINSIAELINKLITGEENDIDEDGDGQTDCNSVKIVQHDFSQQMAKCFELANLSSQDLEKNTFSSEDNLPLNDFYSKIDHPPQVF